PPTPSLFPYTTLFRSRDPASLLAAKTRLSRRRQLPRLHGRNRGRAGARGLLRAQAGTGHESADRERARPLFAQNGIRAIGRRSADRKSTRLNSSHVSI